MFDKSRTGDDVVPVIVKFEVPDTLVTLLLNIFQSVKLKKPFVALVACVIEIVGVAPPVLANGAVAETFVTVPPPFEELIVNTPAVFEIVMLLPAVNVLYSNADAVAFIPKI